MGKNKEMKRLGSAKYIVIIILSAIFDMVLHIVTSNYTVIPENIKWSSLSKLLGVPFTSALWTFLAFGSVAYIFIKFHNKIPGTKFTKGLYYGISVGLLWLIATLAGVSTFGNPFINELVTGICDALPVIIMGCLLGVFTAEDNSVKNYNKPLNMRNVVISIIIFTIVFTIGRYLSYFFNFIKSGYQTNPYYTFFWTISMGIYIGISYLTLGQATKSPSTIQSSIKFGLIIFGVNWAVFGIFMPLLLDGFIKDFVSTVLTDTISVIISYYLSETILYKTKSKSSTIINRRYKL